MIVDAHAHAWPTWPYPGDAVPCDTDALMHSLDANGVDQALVVAARLGGQSGNNEYVMHAAREHPDRLWAAVEVGAFFGPPSEGAADDLRRLIDAGPVSAVALFPDPAAPGWLTSGTGRAVLDIAAEHRLLVSIAAPPSLQADLRVVAALYPALTFLMHHAGMVPERDDLAQVTQTAAAPNVYVKLSGLHYSDLDHSELVNTLAAAYGYHRLAWGSDFPSSLRREVSYAQALGIVREQIPPNDRPAVLGGTMMSLLSAR
ncbi:hypothetical protein BH10ACT7_BH10ACT7_23880 [soil metagenome]